MKLHVCNIQNFCTHDGPGIRTVLFFAGCPMRCAWCHNPETWSIKPIVAYDKTKCIMCGECEQCPNGIHTFTNGHEFKKIGCSVCGSCVEKCPTGALSLTLKEYTCEEIAELINIQSVFYGENGGVTFSGGEPLMQWEQISELCEMISAHKAIETSGYAKEKVFTKMLSKVEYVMMDIKLADKAKHMEYTGVSNEIIIENFKTLQQSGVDYCIRTPLIPGITDTDENLFAIREIIGESKWEKLPYNVLTPQKYERIGMKYALQKKETGR